MVYVLQIPSDPYISLNRCKPVAKATALHKKTSQQFENDDFKTSFTQNATTDFDVKLTQVFSSAYIILHHSDGLLQ